MVTNTLVQVNHETNVILPKLQVPDCNSISSPLLSFSDINPCAHHIVCPKGLKNKNKDEKNVINSIIQCLFTARFTVRLGFCGIIK